MNSEYSRRLAMLLWLRYNGGVEITAEVKLLYEQLLKELNKFGKIVVEEKKASFHIKGSGAAFAGVHPRKTYFIINIVAAAAIKSPRIMEQEQVSAHRFHNRVKVEKAADIDKELLNWLKEAYLLTA
jgi:sorbitol-specific phosphotransferase system component IIBC